MSLDDTIAAVIALGERQDAYTTGTANNAALAASVNALATTLQAGLDSAGTYLALPQAFGALDVNLSVIAAGILAGNTAALAWTKRVQTILGRP